MPSNEDYIDPSIVIETDELESCLSDPNLRVIDCNIIMQPKSGGGYTVTSGRADWEQAHVPNSCFIELGKELSADHPKLVYMMPSPAQFEQVMSGLGIGNEHKVVVYSRGANFWATRLFLMFREFGFENVRVLNGGWDRWAAQGRPVVSDLPSWPAAQFQAGDPSGVFVGKEQVLAAINEPQTCIVNALSPEVHSGTAFSPGYGRPGHIKGSVNLYAFDLINPETGRFLGADIMREKFKAIGALDAERVIAYCGGGISATTDAFALLLLGNSAVTVYDGSMLEWGNNPDLPMESG
jgi:thiosulfate/3-mercaptopyruvate sulfurtransferase